LAKAKNCGVGDTSVEEAILVAIVAGLGWIFSYLSTRDSNRNTLTTIKYQLKEARYEQINQDKQARRSEQREYFLDLMTILREQRSILQFMQDKSDFDTPGGTKKREEAYGLAYAAMLCVPDADIQQAAEEVINPKSTPSQKLQGIDQALRLLGTLVTRLHDVDSMTDD
jgi:hypothetical protein